MKHLYLSGLCCFLLLWGCQPDEAHAPSEEKSQSERIETPHSDFLTLFQATVNAPSGLNFRDAPKGKVLGKFLNGAILDIVEHSGVIDEVIDENRARHGEWLGVQHQDQIVYVFEPFLKPVHTSEDFSQALRPEKSPRLFAINSYYSEEKVDAIFVSLLEERHWDGNSETQLLNPDWVESGELKITYTLEGTYRERLLEQAGISETDKVFVYQYTQDRHYVYPVSSLKTIATQSPYGGGGWANVEDGYMFGFSFRDKWPQKADDLLYFGLVAVGKETPFLQGHIHPMIWEPIPQDSFPAVSLDERWQKRLQYYRERFVPQAYHYRQDSLTYSLLHLSPKRGEQGAFHLMVTCKGEVLFNEAKNDSEGGLLYPLSVKGQENLSRTYQWSGYLLKNHPPVMLGFLSTIFGCPWIDLLDGSGKKITIHCDNRH